MVLNGFAVDPDSLDDEVTGLELGLPARPIEPDREGWAARVDVPRTQVDLAIEGDGDTRGAAALLIEPLEPTRGLRLRISPVLEVTDARWRLVTAGDTTEAHLLGALNDGETAPDTEPDAPAALSGERVPFVQERHNRRLDADLFERWVTVALPRTVAADERFILELAYEGELIQRLRERREFNLKDTQGWRPRHQDSRTSQLDLTFRVPERYRVASGGTLTEERVDDGTRIMRWVTGEPVGSMAFHFGEFDVTEIDADARPAVSVYGSDNHMGFAPGNREKTVADLTDSIRTYTDYFGPFPFASLLVTETPAPSGQAFTGAGPAVLSDVSVSCTPAKRNCSGRTRWRTSGGAWHSTGWTTATSGCPRALPTTPRRSTCFMASRSRTSSWTCSMPGGWTCSARDVRVRGSGSSTMGSVRRLCDGVMGTTLAR